MSKHSTKRLSALTAIVLTQLPGAAFTQSEMPMHVLDAAVWLYRSDARKYDWDRVDGGYRHDEGFVSDALAEAIRAAILSAEEEPCDLLAQVGVTPEAIAAHEDDILRAAWPESRRATPASARRLPPNLGYLLTYDWVAPRARWWLTQRRDFGDGARELRVEIPGSPRIVVKSTSTNPWKLPWDIEAGRFWTSNDLRVSRAVAPLLESDGPNAPVVDGSEYWSNQFWHDSRFWCALGGEIDAVLSRDSCRELDGFELLDAAFSIDEARTRAIGTTFDSLYVQLQSRRPGPFRAVRWWNRLDDRRPSYSWHDFLAIYDAAVQCVRQHPWLAQWCDTPQRTIELNLVGRLGAAERMRQSDVAPPWSDVGLDGEPEFQVTLQRNNAWCGTVWLSSSSASSIVVAARRSGGVHWFNRLEISPSGKKPTYAIVDADGQVTLHAREN